MEHDIDVRPEAVKAVIVLMRWPTKLAFAGSVVIVIAADVVDPAKVVPLKLAIYLFAAPTG